MEEDDLIQFSNGQKAAALANGSSNAATMDLDELKKQLQRRLNVEDDLDGATTELGMDIPEDDDDDDDMASVGHVDEQQTDYLDSLEPCPCYAKCCLDSLISLFCVTLLG